MEVLRSWIADKRSEGDHDAALMGQYQLYMLTGQTKLEDLQNDRYPEIRPRRSTKCGSPALPVTAQRSLASGSRMDGVSGAAR